MFSNTTATLQSRIAGQEKGNNRLQVLIYIDWQRVPHAPTAILRRLFGKRQAYLENVNNTPG